MGQSPFSGVVEGATSGVSGSTVALLIPVFEFLKVFIQAREGSKEECLLCVCVHVFVGVCECVCKEATLYKYDLSPPC